MNSHISASSGRLLIAAACVFPVVWSVGLVLFVSGQVAAFSGQTTGKGSAHIELLVGLNSADLEIGTWPGEVLRVKRIPGSSIYRVWVSARRAEEVCTELRARRAVDYVERADMLSVPQDFGLSPVDAFPAPQAGAQPYNWLEAVQAGDLAALGSGKGVVVAVVDTGMDLKNSWFASRVWTNPAEQPGNGVDDGRNGYRDDWTGWNFGEENNRVQDDHGHGTLVSSTVQTIAPDARIMPLKVNQNGESHFSMGNVVEALYYALQAEADVINLSFSSTEYSVSMARAVQDAHQSGIVLVAAAGNNGQEVEYPARLAEPIAVGALDTRGDRAEFSNFGCRLDLMAPGTDILTLGLNKTWSYVSGTSFSTAMVSGAAALSVSMNPYLSPGSVTWLLQSGSPFQIQNSFLACMLPVPHLNGREVLAAALPQPELSEVTGEASNSIERVKLSVRFPPTHTPSFFYFGLLLKGEWFWLAQDGGLQQATIQVPSLGELPALEHSASVTVFGPQGLFPALDRKQISGQSFELLLALADRQGRLITPLDVTLLDIAD